MTIEDSRLEAVARFNSFDLENDPELVEIIELASLITNTPYALITFLDRETQYLKVRKGVKETTLPRKITLCEHAIEQNSLMLVPDIKKDGRFNDKPLVSGESKVNFYAGMPLTTNAGLNVGTLCVFDVEPHHLTAQQQLVLKVLAGQVIKILELKLGLEMLKKSKLELYEQIQINNDANIRLRSFFESSTNFQVLLGKNSEVIDYNKTAYNFIRTVHQMKIKRGDDFVQYLHPSFKNTFIERYNHALLGVKALEEGSTDYEGTGTIWWEAFFEPAYDEHNEIIGISYIIRNVTERRLKEQKIVAQNQSLLKIAHIQAHEFRGPLTTVMGLMNLIREENYIVPVEYFEFLDGAVNKLDSKIRQIVTDIEHNVVGDGVAHY